MHPGPQEKVLQEAIKEAEQACEGGATGECAAAWDNVSAWCRFCAGARGFGRVVFGFWGQQRFRGTALCVSGASLAAQVRPRSPSPRCSFRAG
jgi:hypothetical protein